MSVSSALNFGPDVPSHIDQYKGLSDVYKLDELSQEFHIYQTISTHR